MLRILTFVAICLASVSVRGDDADKKVAAAQYEICVLKQKTFDELFKSKSDACVANLASYRQCAQKVADNKSGDTGKGALIGLGAAFVTGGASLFWTGAGALIGHETAADVDSVCGQQPDCEQNTLVAEVEKIVGPRPMECVKVKGR